MVLRGVGVRVLVDDVPPMYDFYTGIIGFKVIYGDRDSSFVAFSEADGDKLAFSIFAKTGMQDYKGYTPLAGNGKADQVVYCTGVDDIDGYYQELKGKGVNLVGEPQSIAKWEMRCFYFRDPEGNLFEVSGPIK